jgi:hypothetical protein
VDPDVPRTRIARDAAERALIRIVHHYGSRPEFVVLGGLVPELLCSGSRVRHAGTTDVRQCGAGSMWALRVEEAGQS